MSIYVMLNFNYCGKLLNGSYFTYKFMGSACYFVGLTTACEMLQCAFYDKVVWC